MRFNKRHLIQTRLYKRHGCISRYLWWIIRHNLSLRYAKLHILYMWFIINGIYQMDHDFVDIITNNSEQTKANREECQDSWQWPRHKWCISWTKYNNIQPVLLIIWSYLRKIKLPCFTWHLSSSCHLWFSLHFSGI